MIVDPTGSTSVTGAIRHAARLTGTNFQYLLATAQVESNLNPNAKVSTSSAKGLFQFIEQTWLATLKEQGPALGYGPYADAISRLPSGRYAVTTPGMYRNVMNLRSDPTANAVMAGAFTRANAAQLSEQLGRKPTEGDLYVAHFFGPNGAARIISLAEKYPGAKAAQSFPSAARANPSIFYDRHGRARTASEVYAVLTKRYNVARARQGNAVAVADAAPAAAKPEAVAQPAMDRATVAAISPARDIVPASTEIDLASLPTIDPIPMPTPDTAGLTAAYAAADPPQPSATEREARSVFHSLFSTGPRREAVAPMVSALWTAPSSGTADASAPDGRSMRDLFQDRWPGARPAPGNKG